MEIIHLSRTRPWALVLTAFLFFASPARAQGRESLAQALDSLLDIPVSTASKYAQTSREAAASVTIITSEEIQRQGFQTVAEVLETVPGFYLTNNRSYQSLGVRGFSPLLGDNNRMLLLLDGHPLNENFQDVARLGSALGIDLSLLDRIEVVRGPGSALYGSNAMLAVVNLVTKSDRYEGLDVGTEVGTGGLRQGSILAGRSFSFGMDLVASAMWREATGAALYFPEWATPANPTGRTDGTDGQEARGLFMSARMGPGRLLAYVADRVKGIPTAPFGSDFDDRAGKSIDRRFFVEASYERELGLRNALSLRGYFDGAGWTVLYPFDSTGDTEGRTGGRWIGMESRLRWDATSAHRITFGAELRNNLMASIEGASPVFGTTEGNFRSTVGSLYAQADLQLLEPLHLTGGARVDHYTSVGTALSPRGALVYNGARGTTFKALYGEAFRAPNQFELNVHAPPFVRRNPGIGPERIRTAELVWEQRVGDASYTTVSVYDYTMTDLILAANDPQDMALVFQNSGSGSARGLETSIDWSPRRGTNVRLAYGLQNASRGDGEQLANSPQHSLRASAFASRVPLVDIGLRATYDSGRKGRVGKAGTPSYLLVSATVASRGLPFGRVSMVADNVFDVAYGHPAGPEYLQAAHPQDGRAIRLRVDLTF